MRIVWNSTWIAGISAAIVLSFSPGGFAAEVDDILSTFEIHPAFQLEAFAVEPAVTDPVDMTFDERGRAFVLEMPGYPFPKDPGHIVMLSDQDGDGLFETRKEFAEGFRIADSILAYNGGFLVASPPELVFVKDTDGDDVADVYETVLKGFRPGNQQHNFAGLTWGVDGWVYGVNGGNGGEVYWPDDPDRKVSVRGYDFRVDLRNKVFEQYGRSSGGFEMGMDDWGNVFTTHNLIHVHHIVFPSRYLHYASPGSSGTLTEISDHVDGGLGRIFPIGRQETRVNHPEQSGYFSGACGIHYYGGNAFPEEFNGNVFVCDVVLNLVHRDVLSPDGTTFSASRGRERAEFLASTDRSFRPVSMTTGPDGALYVVDMHRDVIEHPEWIPDELEAELDVDAGKDQGRIFRVVSKEGLARVAPRFDRNDIESVVAALDHPNRWHRDTAQRLLLEWEDDRTVHHLREFLTKAQTAQGRVHALWTLERLGALTPDDVFRIVEDPHPRIREQAIKLAETHSFAHPELLERVTAKVEDEDARVRLQAALSLSMLEGRKSGTIMSALERTAWRDADDRWMRLALAEAVGAEGAKFIRMEMADPKPLMQTDGGRNLLKAVAEQVAQHGPASEIVYAVDGIEHESDAAVLFAGFADGLEKRRGDKPDLSAIHPNLELYMTGWSPEVMLSAWRLASLAEMDTRDARVRVLGDAKDKVLAKSEAVETRIQYLRMVEYAPFADREALLFELLGTAHPKPMQLEAIKQLSRVDSRAVAERLIETWRTLGRETREVARDILLYRRENQPLLLTALEDGRLRIGQLNMHLERRRALLFSRDADIQRRAEALFSDAGVVTRKEALEAMRPAVDMKGDAAKGKKVFEETCSKCHVIGGEGTNIGPNLTDIFRKSGLTLLHDIVDPNAAVDTEYISFTLVTKEGEYHSGIIVSEDESQVTLRAADGSERTFSREEIGEFYSTGLSLMPEELEAEMAVSTMADLLAYLQEGR